MKVLLTGANGGIGKSLTVSLLRRGVDVIACCRHLTSEYLDWINSLTHDYKNQIHVEILDLSSSDFVKRDIKNIIEKHEIQGLVNNAASATGSLFMMTSQNTLKDTFEVNFFSTIVITQAVARVMMKKRNGRIVNISSISSDFSSRGFLAYGASKAALDYATRIMAEELSTYGISVNSVAPGLTETSMLGRMDSESREWFRELSFSKRFSQPDEIANVITYLLLDSPTQLTGKVISVDGGMP